MITPNVQDPSEIMDRLQRVSRLITADLARLDGERMLHYDSDIWEETWKNWSTYLIKFYYQSADPIRDFRGLNDVYTIQVQRPDEEHPIEVQDSIALHIHVELMRIRIILRWDDLKDMTKWVPPVDPLWDDMPSKSPLLFTQRELRETMEHLVAKMSALPLSQPLLEFIEHMELKLGMMYCNALPIETIMNDEDFCQQYDTDECAIPNRKWLLWASIYHTEAILIPLYYYRLVPTWEQDDEEMPTIDSLIPFREWIDKLCHCPEDQLRQIKVKAIDEAYRFPGDEAWYAITYPNAPNNRSDILTQLHEFTYLAPYRLAIDMSLPVLLGQSANNNELLGSLFVLEMVNHWFLTTYEMEWMNCYCLEEQALETAVKRLEFCQDDPFILRRMYRYVILYQRQVIETRNIFETIALWFEIVTCFERTTCRCGYFFRNRFKLVLPWTDEGDMSESDESDDRVRVNDDDVILI